MKPMFHLKPKPRPPSWTGAETFGQEVDSSAIDHDAGMAAVEPLVHLLQEADGLEVFVAAIFVRHPFAVLARIVEVEHRGDGIDAQAVEMEFLGPVERRC